MSGTISTATSRPSGAIGTPSAITVDFGTLGEDTAQGEKDTVTMRDRDTLKQERIPKSEVRARIEALLRPGA